MRPVEEYVGSERYLVHCQRRASCKKQNCTQSAKEATYSTDRHGHGSISCCLPGNIDGHYQTNFRYYRNSPADQSLQSLGIAARGCNLWLYKWLCVVLLQLLERPQSSSLPLRRSSTRAVCSQTCLRK